MLTDRMISVIVPCYRDEHNIREMIRRLKAVFAQITPNWEVVYVNDASPDDSARVLEEVAAEEPNVTVVSFSRNFGVMSVFQAGMDYARGDAVITMDGDLQDPPEVIAQFVERWLEGHLVVYGVRATREERWYRRLGYRLFYRMWRRLADIEIARDVGEFALIDRRVVEVVRALPERDRFLRGLRSWAGFPQVGVAYHRPDRHAGETTQSLISYMGWAMKAVTAFSVKPLRLVSLLTVVMALFMLGVFAANVFFVLFGVDAPHGFFTTLFIILFGTTAQLLALAIISEYLILVVREVKGRPHYIVESVRRPGTEDDGP